MSDVDLPPVPAASESPGFAPLPTIPFEMAVLPNGLTLVVHEDRRHPLICSQLRFNVGSKDEPAGRTGFAHLFEHLMFKSSANRRGNWHGMLQSMGGVGVNGTTNLDRTNYFQTVPKSALDQLLWMESDRMGHLLAGIDAATLADEISVVKNEKRQREGEPYGRVFETITTSLYPKEHPYGHTVLGSFEDLDNANLETVADWHAQWYGASNAVLVLSGDIGFDEALRKVEHWFGAMPAGRPARRATQWMPEVRETRRITLYDRVPFRQLIFIWSTPNGLDLDSTYLQAIAAILARGINSPLHRRLVEQEALCLNVAARQEERYICSEFHIVATLLAGVDPAAVKAAIDEVLREFIATGPSAQDVDQTRRVSRRALFGALDNIGTVADILAGSMIAHGRPDGHQPLLDLADRVTGEQLRDTAARWLSRQTLELDVRPYEAVSSGIDRAVRTVSPGMGEIHAPPFPEVQRATLDNGLSIQLARMPTSFGASFALHLGNGARLDPVDMVGLSAVTLAALDLGTQERTRQDLATMLDEKGINYSSAIRNEFAVLTMHALRDEVPGAMNIMAEMLLSPAFPERELTSLLARQIANADVVGLAAAAAADMAVARLIFGPEHDYGRSGGPDHLRCITADAIRLRHRAWLRPGDATLLVVGDFELDAITEMAQAAFGAWAASGEIQPSRPSIWKPHPGRYFIARPGSSQTSLRIALASPEIRFGDQALNLFNLIFGGAFNSRINVSLREQKGWTYGANSSFAAYPEIGAFGISTDVQPDRALDAVREIEAQLSALTSERQISKSEIEEARHAMLVGLPSAWAGNASVLAALVDRLVFGLPDDFHNRIEPSIRRVTPDDLARVSTLVGDPSNFSWVVAGDGIHDSDTDFARIDEHGNPVAAM